MKAEYWDRFMMTGKVEDYLRYKDKNEAAEDLQTERLEETSEAGKEKRESDRIDRNGAFYSACRRI